MSPRSRSRRSGLSYLPFTTAIIPLALAGSCDIYASGGTPCVAAHSTTRCLYDGYNGPLYQITRGSDNTTADINPTQTGGVADASSQDSFCSGTTCIITTIYDQSGKGNDLTAAPPGGEAQGANPGGFDFVASAVGAPVTLNGAKAYGVFVSPGTGYRRDQTNGVATGNDPEGIYAVLDGTHFNGACCFDYGNAEMSNTDTGATHMEALYFGDAGGVHQGSGSGPWFEADLENGLFAGNITASSDANPSNPSIDYRFATGIVKGNSSNLWAIRGGNAQSGDLGDFFVGERPPGYYPMNKNGSIILGIGGDNSDSAQGTFYEGAMVSGYPSDDTENQVQANIVSAGYGTTSLLSGPPLTVGSNISFQSSANGQAVYLGHNGSTVSTVTSPSAGTTFTITNGNGFSGCYSFEAADAPGSFLRHSQNQLFCDPMNSARNSADWADDSTFCSETGFSGSNTNAFRSWSYPIRYFRALDDGTVFIGANGGPFDQDSSNDFDQQTSWTIQSNGGSTPSQQASASASATQNLATVRQTSGAGRRKRPGSFKGLNRLNPEW